jgi:hypothetical protein
MIWLKVIKPQFNHIHENGKIISTPKFTYPGWAMGGIWGNKCLCCQRFPLTSTHTTHTYDGYFFIINATNKHPTNTLIHYRFFQSLIQKCCSKRTRSSKRNTQNSETISPIPLGNYGWFLAHHNYKYKRWRVMMNPR